MWCCFLVSKGFVGVNISDDTETIDCVWVYVCVRALVCAKACVHACEGACAYAFVLACVNLGSTTQGWDDKCYNKYCQRVHFVTLYH